MEMRIKLRMLRTDRGGEFTSNEFTKYCKENGIARQLTAPYSPQQNGVVERRNRTVLSTTRNKTPYEALYNRKPNLENLRIFGCTAYAKITIPHLKKLDDRSIPMIYLGVEEGSKACRIPNTDPNSPITPPTYTYHPNSKEEEEATISSLRNTENRFDDTPVRVKKDNVKVDNNLSNKPTRQETQISWQEAKGHIDIRYHFIRECVENGHINVEHVSGELQRADILTKALPRLKFVTMRQMLGVQDFRRSTRSRILSPASSWSHLTFCRQLIGQEVVELCLLGGVQMGIETLGCSVHDVMRQLCITKRGLPRANLSLITRANTKDLFGALYLNPVPRKAMAYNFPVLFNCWIFQLSFTLSLPFIVGDTTRTKWHQTFEFPNDGSLLALHVKDHNALLPTSSIGDCIVLPSIQCYPIQHKTVDIDSQQVIIEHLAKDGKKNVFWSINEELQGSLLNLKNTMYHSRQILRISRLRRIQDHCLTLKNASDVWLKKLNLLCVHHGFVGGILGISDLSEHFYSRRIQDEMLVCIVVENGILKDCQDTPNHPDDPIQLVNACDGLALLIKTPVKNLRKNLHKLTIIVCS
ncbi:zinc finger, CCHC-type containing protein [Tanacetum coccineum]